MVSSGTCASNGGPFTETVCIAPYPSGYNLSSIGQEESYSYSINLTIRAGKTFTSRISSRNSTAPILYMGRIVGNVSVENVSSQQEPPGGAVLSGPRYGYVNSTYLSRYETATSNLNSVLGYYNSSWVSYDIASEIQQTASSYDNYKNQVIAGSRNMTQYGCEISAGSLRCSATYLFYYIINASISPKYFSGNQTITYEGSVIRVHN